MHSFICPIQNNVAAARHLDNGLNWSDSNNAGPRQDLSFSPEEVTGLAAASVNIGY